MKRVNFSFLKSLLTQYEYNSELNKYYFDINQVFSHVTLGRSFADEYYNQINDIPFDEVTITSSSYY